VRSFEASAPDSLHQQAQALVASHQSQRSPRRSLRWFSPLVLAGAGTIAWRGGVSYRLLTENGATIVTWLRDGHLCILSGHGVSSATLLKLASWSDHNATAS
jgi:hypothetical protein